MEDKELYNINANIYQDNSSIENISTYIKELEEKRDLLIKQEYYTKAKEYDIEIETCKAKETEYKTKSLKQIHTSELIQLKDEYNIKQKALIKKWAAKEREMNNIIYDKLNAMNKKHNKEREALQLGNNFHMMNSTMTSSFVNTARNSFHRPPSTYLNLKKKQEMIFKGKNRDYTLAGQLKRESEKILKEEKYKQIIRLKTDSQKEYHKLIKRQEEEMNKVQYEIKSNLDLMALNKEKEFALLNQTLKNKTEYVNRTLKKEELLVKKSEKIRHRSCLTRHNANYIQSVIIDKDNPLFQKYFMKSKNSPNHKTKKTKKTDINEYQ